MKSKAYYRYEVGSYIRLCPFLFLPLVRLNNKIRHQGWPAAINHSTDLVLEGYFRSGNTFATRAFMTSQIESLKLAHHTHATSTLIYAKRWSIPALVLLRSPADTVISATLKFPGTTVQQHLRWYLRYYRVVYKLRQHLYVALFDEMSEDFGAVILKVNERYNTSFAPFSHTPENVQAVFDWIEEMDSRVNGKDISRYSIPIPARGVYKEALLADLKHEQNADLLGRCNLIYSLIVKDRNHG